MIYTLDKTITAIPWCVGGAALGIGLVLLRRPGGALLKMLLFAVAVLALGVFGPSMQMNRIELTAESFYLRTGAWWSPNEHRFLLRDVDGVEIMTIPESDGRPRKFMRVALKSGAIDEVPMGDLFRLHEGDILRAVAPSARFECRDSSSDLFFFPEGSLGQTTKDFDADGFLRKWYSKHLRAMTEPPLSCKDPGGESYRFLWLRTGGPPVAIRIRVEKKGLPSLSAVELDGAGGYEPGKVRRRVHRELTADEWSRVSRQIKAIDFWTMPGQEKRIGIDGAHWIFEERSGSAYHIVARWSPREGPYRDLCLSLLSLAGLPAPGTREERDTVY